MLQRNWWLDCVLLLWSQEIRLYDTNVPVCCTNTQSYFSLWAPETRFRAAIKEGREHWMFSHVAKCRVSVLRSCEVSLSRKMQITDWLCFLINQQIKEFMVKCLSLIAWSHRMCSNDYVLWCFIFRYVAMHSQKKHTGEISVIFHLGNSSLTK